MKNDCEIVAPVFENYRNNLARFIQSRVKDPVESEELLSEVMMKIYKNCEKIEGIRNTEAWLITIARNTINDYFREHQKTGRGELKEETVEEDDPNLIQSLSACVPSLLNKLPPKYAQPLIQHEMEGISQKDLAVQYNMSESGLKSRVQRGRKMLKSLFTEYCGHLLEEQEECNKCSC